MLSKFCTGYSRVEIHMSLLLLTSSKENIIIVIIYSSNIL